MKIFKDRTFMWWQVGILKVALILIGIAVGSYWSDFFAPYVTVFVLVGLLLGVYIAYATVGRD